MGAKGDLGLFYNPVVQAAHLSIFEAFVFKILRHFWQSLAISDHGAGFVAPPLSASGHEK